MEIQQVKSEMVRVIQELPDDATIEDAMERLYVLYKLNRGMEDGKAGRKISHEEALERIKQWHV